LAGRAAAAIPFAHAKNGSRCWSLSRLDSKPEPCFGCAQTSRPGLPIENPAPADKLPPNTEELARSLFGSYLLPSEIVSILLLVAMVGAVIMAKKRTDALMPISHYLFLSLALFLIGCIGVTTRRNVIIVLMSIELILNAVNINLVAFSRYFAMLRDKSSPSSSLPTRPPKQSSASASSWPSFAIAKPSSPTKWIS